MKEIAEAIKKVREHDGWVYICGNGGSASTANHFANDLVKMCEVKAMSLCANEAIVMAYANDDGYERIFVEQLAVFFDFGKDLLITISGSGTSPNILKAIQYADKENTVSFPTMKELGCDMARAEDCHLVLVHKIIDYLMK